MEGLLILVGIYVLDIVIKKVVASKKNKQSDRSATEEDQDSYSEQPQTTPKRSLQDLIRQFEEAQRDASGGTYVPPTPPIESDNEGLDEEEYNQVDCPVVRPATPGEFTFTEIAQSVVQWEYVSVELLQQVFGFSETIAQKVLAELQAKRIVGRDMGEGDCALLVHDQTELANHFKRLQREAEEQSAAAAEQEALRARREAELKHQRELAELEERAKQAREQAGQPAVTTSLAEANHSTRPRTFNRDEIRRGFVWAKVLDEPRFKKRWTAKAR